MRIKRDETGAAAVEFAIILILLMVLLFAIIEFGLGFYQAQGANAGVREAARRAAVGQITSCSTPANLYKDLKYIVDGSVNGVPHGTAKLAYTLDPANLTGSPRAGDTVTITMPYTIDLGTLAGFIPGFPSSINSTASAQTRVEQKLATSVASC